MDQASYVFPSGEPGRLSLQASSQLVTMLNWAMSPHVKRLNMAFVLIDEKLADLSDRLTGNPHVATIEVPLPDEKRARAFIAGHDAARRRSPASRTSTRRSWPTLDRRHFADRSQRADPVGARKRQAARRRRRSARSRSGCSSGSATGCSSSSSRRWTLDTVVGHEAAKARLREDAALLKRGALDSLPMGYLLCGPVGTGKSFLAQCVSGEIGVPCVILKNFRSKYVGETEGNLERVLSVLRAMGPVVVVVDEADAALGSREPDGDSGTSSRVFAMIAAQMGDTQLSRPDHLDAAHRAPRPAADRPQAPGPRGSAHPALLSDRRERDPADVRHPGEEAGIAAGGRGRAADSAARPAVGRRHRRHGRPRAGARRCWPAPITSRARRWPKWWRSSCRRRRGSSASCRKTAAIARVHRPAVPAAGDSREDGQRRGPRRSCRRGSRRSNRLVQEL